MKKGFNTGGFPLWREVWSRAFTDEELSLVKSATVEWEEYPYIQVIIEGESEPYKLMLSPRSKFPIGQSIDLATCQIVDCILFDGTEVIWVLI